MEYVVFMAVVNLGLSFWVISLQNKLRKTVTVLGLCHVGLMKVADGEVRVVRTADGVKFELIEGV